MSIRKNETVNAIRYCKKCGCELASTSKYKLCENCRRNRNEKIRNLVVGIVAGAASVAVAAVNHFSGKLSESNDTNKRMDENERENDSYSGEDAESNEE